MGDRLARAVAALFAIGGGLVLSGCGSQGGGELVVTYAAADGSSQSVTVPVDAPRCTALAGAPLLRAPEGDAVITAMPVAGSADTWALSVAIGDGMTFVSDGAFEADESGFTVDDLSGVVTAKESDGTVTGISADAHVSGRFEC
ncbi:MAG: hypothetical protein HGA44_19060 [Cellulomonadaceae bacterium]|nr:hypothetical protein [Cellulomonadaceae bacterium]